MKKIFFLMLISSYIAYGNEDVIEARAAHSVNQKCDRLDLYIPVTDVQHIILGYLDSWEEAQLLDHDYDQDEIYSLSASSDGTYLAVGSLRGKITIWQNDNQFKLLQSRSCANSPINSLSFSPGNDYLAYGFGFKIAISQRKNNQFETVQICRDHDSCVIQVAFSSDGKYLASGSDDKSIKIWQKINNKFIVTQSLLGHEGKIRSISFSPNSQYLASASWDKTTRVWRHKDNQFILSQTGRDKLKIRMLKNEKFEFLQELNGHQGSIYALAFSPQSNCLASASGDKGSLFIWRVKNDAFKVHQKLEGAFGDTLSFSSNGKYLIFALYNTTGVNHKTVKICKNQAIELMGKMNQCLSQL